ncbi:hypothetical protein GCM10023231_22110 [Olivibacter ginsenosidimutans]|uniref:CSD domain-containing protein n=1 Tax=Olivibacter ginsenosidimutans TaxID=1176537 RepID=A0ABP9BED9_9SPHI
MNLNTMEIGVIKWFNNSKGFGVADTTNGQVFVHIKSFKLKPNNLSPRDTILFKKRADPKSQNAVAIHTRLVGEVHDWELIATLALKENPTVKIGHTSTKNPNLHLAELAAYQYLNGKSRDQIFDEVVHYFSNKLPDDKFLMYGEFIEKVFTRSMGLEKRNELLSKIFHFFGSQVNERKLFLVWKFNKFSYIGQDGADDFEIPESILVLFADELGVTELQRIHTYSYGGIFCNELIAKKLENAENLTTEEIKKLEMINHVKFFKE